MCADLVVPSAESETGGLRVIRLARLTRLLRLLRLLKLLKYVGCECNPAREPGAHYCCRSPYIQLRCPPVPEQSWMDPV